jgi:phosphatidylserine decarboxylase
MALRAGHYELIAREGLPFIIPLVAASLILWWLEYPLSSFVFLLASVAVACFFRNPERTSPDIDGVVLSPADGVVRAG